MIYLPAIEKRVSLGQYVTAVKFAKMNPDREFSCGLTCWWPCKGSEIVKQFFDGVQDRINQNQSYAERGKS